MRIGFHLTPFWSPTDRGATRIIGQLMNADLVDYPVPRALDLPARLRCLFVENGDGAGPFGAKGAGEGSLIPVSPAIGNALTRLNGVRFRELPLTPERVWRALRSDERPDGQVLVTRASRRRDHPALGWKAGR